MERNQRDVRSDSKVFLALCARGLVRTTLRTSTHSVDQPLSIRRVIVAPFVHAVIRSSDQALRVSFCHSSRGCNEADGL